MKKYDIKNTDLIDENEYKTKEELFNVLNYLIDILIDNLLIILKDNFFITMQLNIFKNLKKENNDQYISLISNNIINYDIEIITTNDDFFLNSNDLKDNLFYLLKSIWFNDLSYLNKKLIWNSLIDILIISKKYVDIIKK